MAEIIEIGQFQKPDPHQEKMDGINTLNSSLDNLIHNLKKWRAALRKANNVEDHEGDIS